MATEEDAGTVKLAHSIHHTNQPSSNLQRTAEWYGKVFGLKPIDVSRFVPDATTLLLTNGNFHLHFELYPEVVPPRSTFEHRTGEHLFHTCVEVEDWDAFAANLETLGLQYEDYKERPQDKSKSATLTDPDGHGIEIAWHGNRDW